MSKLKFQTIEEFINYISDRNIICCLDLSGQWSLSTKLKSKCLIHNLIYDLIPKTFIKGAGCPECRKSSIGIGNRKSLTTFIKQANLIHNNFYEYDEVIYKNSSTKIIINCKLHGKFLQSPTNHIHGKNGCPICKLHKILSNFKTTSISKSEIDWLDRNRVPDRQYPIGPFFVDGFDPSTNIVYEFLGDFWHGNLSIYNPENINPKNKKSFGELWETTLLRFEYLRKQGYKIIYIWHSDAMKNKDPYIFESRENPQLPL